MHFPALTTPHAVTNEIAEAQRDLHRLNQRIVSFEHEKSTWEDICWNRVVPNRREFLATAVYRNFKPEEAVEIVAADIRDLEREKRAVQGNLDLLRQQLAYLQTHAALPAPVRSPDTAFEFRKDSGWLSFNPCAIIIGMGIIFALIITSSWEQQT